MAAPASEHEQLAYVDVVLRRIAEECPDAAVDMVRAVEYEARVRLRRPVSLCRGSAFEVIGPQVLVAPRTRRTLQLLVAAAEGPLPGMVPFVSAASAEAATVAGAPATGCTVSATVAERAMALHWLAPWGRRDVESVSTRSPADCQRRWTRDGALVPDRAAGADPPTGYLVFAGEDERVDPGDPRWAGGRVGVVRSAPSSGSEDGTGSSMRNSRISVGDVEYVLTDRCP